jgi:hypothetical protein
MIFVPAGSQSFGQIVKIDLAKLVEGSQLVNGFESPLPVLGAINNEIAKQRIAIISGDFEETGVLIGSVGTGNDPLPLSPITQQNATLPPIVLHVNPQGETRNGTVNLGYDSVPYRIRFSDNQ